MTPLTTNGRLLSSAAIPEEATAPLPYVATYGGDKWVRVSFHFCGEIETGHTYHATIENGIVAGGVARLRTMAETAQSRLYDEGRMTPLMTMEEAAAYLHIAPRTLRDHIARGEIRYVAVGGGRGRPRKLFTEDDIQDFVRRQSRMQPCPSTAGRAPRSTATTSKSTVLAFPAQQARPISALPRQRKSVSAPKRKRNWVVDEHIQPL